MKVVRTKYKRTTPKSQTVISHLKFDMSGGIDRLLITVAKFIDKHFGLLYLNIFSSVFR